MFTLDNTEGFTKGQIDELNDALEMLIDIHEAEDDADLQKHLADKVINALSENCQMAHDLVSRIMEAK